MKRYLLLAALLTSTAAVAKDDCKSRCSGIKAACADACNAPSSSNNKKKAAECVSKMCTMAVQQCEAQQCGGANGKKR